jgi:hypothetical protein
VGGDDYLTATIVNNGSSVDVTLDIYVDYPAEFITVIKFALQGSYGTIAVTTSTPTIGLDTCNGNAPAGTGSWDLCLSYDSNDHIGSPTYAQTTFTLSNVQEANFGGVSGGGWTAVAHIQGIEPNCSGWVGSHVEGGVQPQDSLPECVSVPEPNVISLLGMGLVAMLGAGITNGRRRRKAGQDA